MSPVFSTVKVCETFPLASLMTPKSNALSSTEMTAFFCANAMLVATKMAAKMKIIRFICLLGFNVDY